MVDISEPIGMRTASAERPAVPMATRSGFDYGDIGQTVDFTDRQIAGLFAVLAAVTGVPIILFPWPPLADYMNHLSRMHIISTVRSHPDPAQFFHLHF